jgi:hypothetical protein
MTTARLALGRLFVVVFSAGGCSSAASLPYGTLAPDIRADTIAARNLFEENIDAIHKRDRARYLATYLHSNSLARNGPGGLELGYESWSARRDSTWPDTLIAKNLRVLPISPGVVYGTYCYIVTQHDTTSSGVSERLFVRTSDGWRIAVTTAFGLPTGAPAQCK